DAFLGAGPHLHLLDFCSELLGEPVVDAFLHVDAIGAHAGLAGVAVCRGHGAGYGLVEGGVIEDDEGRVAAELAPEPVDRGRARAISRRPISVEPVKVSMRTSGLPVSSLPITLALPVMTLNTPLGMPAL